MELLQLSPAFHQARSLLDQVRFTFSDQSEVYLSFLRLMKWSREVSPMTRERVTELGRRMQLLFRGYPELVHAFNVFMPTGFKVVPLAK